jgi:hypothetical protein
MIRLLGLIPAIIFIIYLFGTNMGDYSWEFNRFFKNFVRFAKFIYQIIVFLTLAIIIISGILWAFGVI